MTTEEITPLEPTGKLPIKFYLYDLEILNVLVIVNVLVNFAVLLKLLNVF